MSSGIFDAEHSKKYETPQNFMQALWNAAGPAVGSMLTQLDLIKVKLEGDEVDVEPNFSKIDPQLIDFLVEEAGENPKEVTNYINTVSIQLVHYGEDKETEEEALHPTKNLSLMTREEAQHQPVRLRECYPEPQRQVMQERLPKKPPL